MIEEELINIWKYSDEQERVKFEKSRLIIDLQTNLDKFEKSLRNRDLRELIPAMVMIPLFGFITYFIPFVLSKVGAGLIVLWCIYLIIRIKSLKKYKPVTPTETYLKYLYKTKEYLSIQKKLLNEVLYWYILPSCTGALLFFLGFEMNPGKLAFFIIITVGLGVIIYVLNKQTVKKEFDPRLDRIDKMISTLNE
ncbi:MAG: hypothetical protein IEMM0006_1632 [bacterium]|nr:MAG: hypothetical protein IEMM0006_1632 [bacterium]